VSERQPQLVLACRRFVFFYLSSIGRAHSG
jgi:hypothetical protein